MKKISAKKISTKIIAMSVINSLIAAIINLGLNAYMRDKMTTGAASKAAQSKPPTGVVGMFHTDMLISTAVSFVFAIVISYFFGKTWYICGFINT